MCGRLGRKIAIVVVDMTRAFGEDRFALGSAKTGQAALRGIQQLLAAGRWYDSCPGIFGHADDAAAHESAEIPAEVAPRTNEAVIVKGKPSAFFGTQDMEMISADVLSLEEILPSARGRVDKPWRLWNGRTCRWPARERR